MSHFLIEGPFADLPFAALPADQDPGSTTPLGQQPQAPDGPRQYLMIGELWDRDGGVGQYGLEDAAVEGEPGLRRAFASSSGYHSLVGDPVVGDLRHFPAILEVPAGARISLLTGGRIDSSAYPAFGSSSIINVDREVEHFKGLHWEGRQVEFFIGRDLEIGPSFSTFGRFALGRVDALSWDESRLSASFASNRQLLDEAVLNPDLYLGLGPALRFEAGPDYVDAGDEHDFGDVSFSMRIMFSIDSADSTSDMYLGGKKSRGGTAWPGYMLWITGIDGAAHLQLSDGTTLVQVNESVTMDRRDGVLHSMFGVVNREEDEALLYIDGELVGTSDISALGSLLSPVNFRFGDLHSAGRPMYGDVSSVDLWSVALTAEEVRGVGGSPALSSLFAGYPAPFARYPLLAGADAVAYEDASVSFTDFLSLDGVDGGGSAVSVAVEDELTVEVHFRSRGTAAARTHLCSHGDSFSASELDFDLIFQVGGALAVNIYRKSGTAYTVSTPQVVRGDRMFHVAVFTVSSGGVAKLYLDGAEVGEVTGVPSAPVASPTLWLGQIAGGGGEYFEGEISMVRTWSTVLDADQVAALGSNLDAIGQTGLTHQYLFDEISGTVAADSSSSSDDLNLTGGYAWGDRHGALTGGSWIGSGEGGVELRGLRRRRVWGTRRMIEGDLVDRQRSVYELSCRSGQSVTPRVNGAYSLTSDGVVDDVYDWTPVAGRYVTQLSPRVLVRFHSLDFEATGNYASGVLTFDVEGDTEGGTFASSTVEIMERMVTTEGGFDPFTDVDLFSVGAAKEKRPGAVGYNTVRDEVRVSTALSQLAEPAFIYWLITVEGGVFLVNAIEDGEGYDVEIGPDRVDSSSLNVTPAAPPSLSQRVSYRPYDVTVDRDSVAGSLTDEEAEDVALAERIYKTPADVSLLESRPDARTEFMHTLYDLRSDAVRIASLRQAFYGVERVVIELAYMGALFQSTIGQRVLISIGDGGADGEAIVMGTDDDEPADQTLLTLLARYRV